MQRISVLERLCGCTLFDKTWSWKESSPKANPPDLASLISCFYQFAGEVDEGVVNRVIFESMPSEKKRSNVYGMTIKASRASRRRSAVSLANSRTIDMFCANNQYVRVAVCVDGNVYEGKGQELAQQIADAFTSEYKEALEGLKGKFNEIFRKPEDAVVDMSFTSQFAGFEKIIERMELEPQKEKAVTSPGMLGTRTSDKLEMALLLNAGTRSSNGGVPNIDEGKEREAPSAASTRSPISPFDLDDLSLSLAY